MRVCVWVHFAQAPVPAYDFSEDETAAATTDADEVPSMEEIFSFLKKTFRVAKYALPVGRPAVCVVVSPTFAPAVVCAGGLRSAISWRWCTSTD